MNQINTKQQELLKQGYTCFSGMFSEHEINALRLTSEAVLFRTSGAHRERYKSNGSLCNLAQYPEYASLLAEPRIGDAIRTLGGDDVRWTSGYLISKPAGGDPLFWHQDWWGWDSSVSYIPQATQLFVMIYLTDTHVHNGCLRVIPGSHRNAHPLHNLPAAHTKDIATQIDTQSPAYASHPDEVAIEVKKGDVIVGDSRLLHGAYANLSEAERPLLTLWYIPSFDQLPEDVQAALQDIYLRKSVDIDDHKDELLTCEQWPDFARQIIKNLIPDYQGSVPALPWNRLPDATKLLKPGTLQDSQFQDSQFQASRSQKSQALQNLNPEQQ